jgi:predicted amidohydrolase YtcJ
MKMTQAAITGDGAVNMVCINGKVVTVDPRFSIAEAFAIRGERFAAIGTNAAIQRLVGPATTVVDLGGRAVFPGFIDTHPHTIYRGLESAVQPSLAGLTSVAQIVQRVGRAARETRPGAWIVTSPIGEPPDYFNLPEGLAEKRWPTRTDLDAVAPNNPVYIPTSAYWPHPAIFNTPALALLDIKRDTPDAFGIAIAKDPVTGEPTGVVYGMIFYNAASPLFRKLSSLLPLVSEEKQLEGIRHALHQNISVGVTTIYEAHGNFHVPLMKKLAASGQMLGRVINGYEIPARLSIQEIDSWMSSNADASGAGTGDDFLKVVGATVSLDGPVQFGLATMHQPYLDPFGKPGNGESAVSIEKLIDICRLAVRHHMRLNIQAAGSKACDMAVEALDTVNRETSIRDQHWILQHFQHPSRASIPKLKEMGICIQTYASTDFSKGIETYINRFPNSDVWKSVVPYRWYFDDEVTAAGSSDGAHFDPAFQIWETLVRVDGRTGRSLLTPDKAVTRQEAIQIHTANGARLLQCEHCLGSIESGKLADFAVLDRNILTVPVDEIRHTKIIMTAVGGKILHDPLSIASGSEINR